MLEGDHARLVDVVLPVCAEYGLALAGGYAIKAHHLVDRPSEDSGAELIALCRAALDDEFNLETLRDQLSYAAMYPDEAFSRYSSDLSMISEARAWAQEWSTQIGLDLAEAEPWSEDGDWTDDE
jgi:hypothetical protein